MTKINLMSSKAIFVGALSTEAVNDLETFTPLDQLSMGGILGCC